MRVSPLPPLPLLPARDPGTFAVIPLPLDLGGLPGTGAGAAWLGRSLSSDDVRALVGVRYEAVDPLLCEVPFGRLEPSLWAAAVTLQAWHLGYRPFSLFGDHGLSYGPVRAAGRFGRPVTVFVFDAHYDRLQGIVDSLGWSCGLENEVHQGNVCTYIGRDPAVRTLVQVGIRQPVAPDEADPVPSVEVITAEDVRRDPAAAAGRIGALVAEALEAGSLVVLSIDVDAVDPAELPAVDHPVGGGLRVPDLVALAAPVATAACAVDIAELNPLHDATGQGRRAALRLACALLAVAAGDDEERAWRSVLGEQPAPLPALGPYTHAVVDAERWLDPGPAGSAITAGLDLDDLRATFTDTALRTAATDLKRHLAVAPHARVTLTVPPATIQPCSSLVGGETHCEAVAVDPRRGLVAVGGWDHAVHVWDVSEPSRPPVRHAGHDAWVVALAVSSDGRLASSSDDGTVRIWHGWGSEDPGVTVCRGHEHWVKAVAWSPDGSQVASASFDGTVAVWDAATGRQCWHVAGHPDNVWGVAWSDDGVLASCGERGLVLLWDAATGEPAGRLAGHLGSVERCRWAPGGLWSLARRGRLLFHPRGASRPSLEVDTGFEQALDCWLLDEGHLLVAGPDRVRCVTTAPVGASADLVAGFPVGGVTGWSGTRAAVAGDAPGILVYEVDGR